MITMFENHVQGISKSWLAIDNFLYQVYQMKLCKLCQRIMKTTGFSNDFQTL